MMEFPGLGSLCFHASLVILCVTVVNATVFLQRGADIETPTPKKTRYLWYFSLGSLVVPVLAFITVAILAYVHFKGSEKFADPAGRALLSLTILNTYWGVAASILFTAWMIRFL